MQKLTTPVVLLLVMLLGHPVTAQQTLTTAKRDLIREFLVVTESEANTNKLVVTYVEETSKQYPKIMEGVIDGDPDLGPAQKNLIKAGLSERRAQFTKRFLELIQERINVGKIVEEISYILYDKHFTEAELKDLIAFYKTPTGKKSLSVMPQLLAESMQLSGEKLTPVLTPILLQVIEEERAGIKKN
jgi:uncharacterized protein